MWAKDTPSRIGAGQELSFPPLPSSQGSPISSKRECSAVAEVSHTGKDSCFTMGVPQHSGTFEVASAISLFCPHISQLKIQLSFIAAPIAIRWM
jgi:hypothetical protein